MSSPKRNRARILTASGLKKLREQIRSHEVEENAGFKYTLERLGELTGLDPETVKNVLDCKGSDKRTIVRCFESFGLTLEDSDHIPAAQAASASSDPGFVGRDEAIADLNALVDRNTKVIVIQARGGVGKTTLARKYLQQEFGSFLEFPIAKETKDIASIEGLVEEKLRQLGEEPGREFLVSLDRLKRKLQAERIGVLIDNLEPALDSAGRFIEPHRRYVELLRVLSDLTVKSITMITSRERVNEYSVLLQHYLLKDLSLKDWKQYFQSRFNFSGQYLDDKNISALTSLHQAYGGNAKAMDILCSAVLTDYSGDINIYWQDNQNDLLFERALEDLVVSQFNRLQQTEPDAYKLICRMGCYRYQDVPTVPVEGLLCLLWDLPENRRKRIIKILQERSLVEYKESDFWLHPVIRAEAISRLRLSHSWQFVNQKAAEFWTQKVKTVESIEDALNALEAYYQYLAIQDYENACSAIIQQRHIEVKNYGISSSYTLADSLCLLGLINQLVHTIVEIIDKVPVSKSLCWIHQNLGIAYRLSGEPQKAIEAHKKAYEISFTFGQRTDQIYALRNIGLCNLELGEFDEAVKIFEEILSSCEASDAKEEKYASAYSTIAKYCLAFLYSDFQKEKATYLAEDVYTKMSVQNIGPRSTGERLLYLAMTYKNLGDPSKALSLYEQTVFFSDQINYPQLKAKAFIGISEIHRDHNDFQVALSYQFQTVEILDRIGARSDMAEAHYQLGLTYREIGEVNNGKIHFQKAIKLFAEMKACKKVAKVEKAMQS